MLKATVLIFKMIVFSEFKISDKNISFYCLVNFLNLQNEHNMIKRTTKLTQQFQTNLHLLEKKTSEINNKSNF